MFFNRRRDWGLGIVELVLWIQLEHERIPNTQYPCPHLSSSLLLPQLLRQRPDVGRCHFHADELSRLRIEHALFLDVCVEASLRGAHGVTPLVSRTSLFAGHLTDA